MYHPHKDDESMAPAAAAVYPTSHGSENTDFAETETADNTALDEEEDPLNEEEEDPVTAHVLSYSSG